MWEVEQRDCDETGPSFPATNTISDYRGDA